MLRCGLWIQSLYYVLTGALPLLNIRLFQVATGPKVDLWLVRMVGLLAVVIGLILGIALRNRRVTPEIIMLAVGTACAFGAIDVIYVAMHRIGSIYLLDAAVQTLVILLVTAGSRKSDMPRPR
ncbi:MAG: hypothetical protein GIW98_01615 [Candidatus Eremiobacteraeota bacterium]|nr:hypothetical protein [Candidatus Eremiobacteraeota bacterium]